MTTQPFSKSKDYSSLILAALAIAALLVLTVPACEPGDVEPPEENGQPNGAGSAETVGMKGGWYDGAFNIQALQHSFVVAESDEGETTYFDCYGGHEGDNLQHTETIEGDISLARLIACGDAEDVREQYDLKSGGYYDLGDSCGILYGVTGVCHQMSNRILYSAENPTIVEPPSSRLSYFLYGVYGPSLPFMTNYMGWSFPEPFITKLKEAQELAVEEAMLKKSIKNTEDPFLKKILRYHLETKTAEANVEGEFEIFIDHFVGEKAELEDKHELLLTHRRLMGQKRALDRRLLGSQIDPQDYAARTNEINRQMLNAIASTIGADAFKEIFGIQPSELEDYTLVREEDVTMAVKHAPRN